MPFGVSSEFEMGMYPPGQGPNRGVVDHQLVSDQLKLVQIENAPEMTLHSSPQKADRGTNKNSKVVNRNIQAKRLSSQTII